MLCLVRGRVACVVSVYNHPPNAPCRDINFASVQEAVLDIPALQEDAGIFQVMPIPVDLRYAELSGVMDGGQWME